MWHWYQNFHSVPWKTWLTGCQTQSARGSMVNIVTILHNCHKNSQFLVIVIIVTIVHEFQNCHTYHNCYVIIVIIKIGHSCQNWSKFQLFITNCDYWTEFLQSVKIVMIDQNCQNWSRLSQLSQSQLSQSQLSQSQLAQLVTIVTFSHNCHTRQGGLCKKMYGLPDVPT